MSRVRRALPVAAAGLLVLVLVIGGALLLREGTGPDAPAAAPVPAASPEVADDVAAALEHLADDPGSLVAAGARERVGSGAVRAVPPGTQVAADPSSWRPDGFGGGVMEVTLSPPDGAPTSYLAVVVQEDGAWKVLATVPEAEEAG